MTMSASYQKYMSTHHLRKRHNLTNFISYAGKGDLQNLITCLDTFVESPLKNQAGWTYRFRAVVNINDKDSETYIERCALTATINIKDDQAMTDSRVKCVEVLLAHGANVQIRFSSHRRLASLVTDFFATRSRQKLYAMTITKKLLAAGYQMTHREEQDILTLLLEKYWEGTSIQVKFFVESLDMGIFTENVVKQCIRNLLHSQVNVSETNNVEGDERRQFLESQLEKFSDVQSLQISCRTFIRRHLLYIHCDKNLYFLIMQLPLPSTIIRFLLLSCYTLPSHSHYGAV